MLGFRKYSNAQQGDSVIRTGLRDDSLPEFQTISVSLQGNSWPAPSAPFQALEAEAKYASGAAHGDSALLYSGFHLPAHDGITSSKHRANSRDLRAQGQVPRVQVPAIPQHGKGANCLPGQAPG